MPQKATFLTQEICQLHDVLIFATLINKSTVKSLYLKVNFYIFRTDKKIKSSQITL
jgi:hypothetical protein